MKPSQFTEEQIIGMLREHEAGAKTADVCRKHGISDDLIPDRQGNLTDRRTGGESGYVLCRRSDAHGRGRRCGWGGPLLRGDEPKGRKAEDHQRGDDNDDESHLQALKRCAKLLRLFFSTENSSRLSHWSAADFGTSNA